MSLAFEAPYRELCSLIGLPEVPGSTRKDFLRLIDGPCKLISVEAHSETAFATNDTPLSFKASDLLVSLLTAARAGDWKKVAILQHEALAPGLMARPG